MPLISPPSPAPTPTCRRYPLLIWSLLVLAPLPPGRAASYRPLTGPSSPDGLDQPSSLPQYYYPTQDAVWGDVVESQAGKPDSGRQGREGVYSERPVLRQLLQGSLRSPLHHEDVAVETGNSNPVMIGKWTSRNRVSKTKTKAYLASPYDFDVGIQDAIRQFQNGRWFRAMPPFQPPPSTSQLPELFRPHTFNYSAPAPFNSIEQRQIRDPATGTEGSNKKVKRGFQTADLHQREYDKGGKVAEQPRPAGGAGSWLIPPPSASLMPELFHSHNLNGIDRQQARTSGYRFEDHTRDFGKQVSRSSVGQTDDQAHTSVAYGVPKRIKGKRVAETADFSLGGYNRGRPLRDGRGKRLNDHGQVFNVMPPFQPPPSSSLLPNLFNDSFSVIGQRPTRPSATRPRLSTDRGLHSDNRGLQDQPSPGPGEGLGPDGTEGVWDSREPGTHQHHGPPFSRPSDPNRGPTTQVLEDFEEPNAQQEQIHPRDVVVTISTPRLQLTYRVMAPPYFTFEGLLSQMATYLIPGFCVDLAVTRRDEHCEIISHMAALQTDRQQTWLIEIVDTGGKIIWMNQCIPDARLFIVPGLRVYFKFGTHDLLAGSAFPVSTPDATPGGTEESEHTARPPPGLPASDTGWVPHGPPLATQKQEPEDS